jgi:hypothetical protein
MKISLREMFLLVLAFGLALGWWLDHYRLQSKNTELTAKFSSACYVAASLVHYLDRNGYVIDWREGLSASDPQGGRIGIYQQASMEEIRKEFGSLK